MMLLQMVPMLLDVILTTPTLWPAALSTLPQALLHADFQSVSTSLQTLLLPVLVCVNLFVIGKQLAKKMFKAKPSVN